MVCSITVHLIRHLPTLGNQKRQYIGWTDESILPIGEPTSVMLPWKPEIVHGSDLMRCRESAALYFPEAIYESDWRFRESHFGAWEGKTYEVLKDNKTYRSWIDDPYEITPPNGESLLEVKGRVLAALLELPEEKAEHFIVTHGGPIRMMLTQFSPEKQDFWFWNIPHGSIWSLKWNHRNDFVEGKKCTSLSAVPITGNELLFESY
jgi:alpha-ribazole phosphatase